MHLEGSDEKRIRKTDLNIKIPTNFHSIHAILFPEQLEKWDVQRKLESSDPDKPVLWSKWIYSKVEAALKLFEPQNCATPNNDYLEAQIQNLKFENAKLSEKVSQLETIEVGNFRSIAEVGFKGIVEIDNYGLYHQ